nr:MAG TPA: hypothetical protein [Bacteriophage sp.]
MLKATIIGMMFANIVAFLVLTLLQAMLLIVRRLISNIVRKF